MSYPRIVSACLATRLASCSLSLPSVKVTVRRWARSWMGAARSGTGRGRFNTIWTGAGPAEPAYHPAPRTGPGAYPVRRVRGRTTGTPIGLLIENVDQRSKDYGEIMDRFRPGHADYTYHQKYGIRDYRGGGRSSARNRAAGGGGRGRPQISARALQGVNIRGYLAQLGPIRPARLVWEEVDNNPFFCGPRPGARTGAVHGCAAQIRRFHRRAVTVVASRVPAGWGEPVFDRLDADIAHALMSINAVKGVEIGAGFASVEQRGTEHRDELTPGVSQQPCRRRVGRNFQRAEVVASIAFETDLQPPPAGAHHRCSRRTGGSGDQGRHDPCVGIRATPIAEAMLALVLMDHALRHRGQNLDVRTDTPMIAAVPRRDPAD